MLRAIELDPANPTYYEILARWYERYTLRLRPESDLRTAYLEQSALHLRRALALRPSSPYTWANLAVVKLRLGQFDKEFQTAVQTAERLGPWESDVQLTLAGIGLRAEDELSRESEEAVRRATANASKRYQKELSELEKRFAR